MTEYFATHEGRVRAVAATGIVTDISKIELLLDALDGYSSRFIYKCHDSFCPMRISRRARHGEPGFGSLEALQQHRIVDHDKHGLRDVQYNVLQHPWYICQCGHYSALSGVELELYEQGKWTDQYDCQERINHLQQVKEHHGDRLH